MGQRAKSFCGITILILTLTIIMLLNSCGSREPDLVLETRAVTDITATTATSGGNMTNKRDIELRSRGICWSISENPMLEDSRTDEGRGKGGFRSNLKGLAPGKVYYVRSYAIKENDTIYGNIVSFTTDSLGEVTDIDGNKYKTIALGLQIWMADNLKTTRYNDGTAIPYVTDAGKWASLSGPGFCWYKNSESTFKPMYGAIYNWYAINDNRLCPEGWHVPDNTDWDHLADYLGGWNSAGGKLKVKGDAYWSTPNTGATNEYMFSALPGGLRYLDGEFRDFGFGGYWWSASEQSAERAFFRHIFYEEVSLFRFDNDKRNGFYVRCIKNH